jgi:hypothetical protein
MIKPDLVDLRGIVMYTISKTGHQRGSAMILLVVIVLIVGLIVWSKRSPRVVVLTPRYIELQGEFLRNEQLLTDLFNYATGKAKAPALPNDTASQYLATIDGQVQAGLWHLLFAKGIALCHDFARNLDYRTSGSDLATMVEASQTAIDALCDRLIKKCSPSTTPA